MLLCDGPNWLWRGHYAARDLQSRGRYTGALHVGLTMLAHLKKLFEPQRVIFLWDHQENWRKKIYPEYKANRERTTDYSAVLSQIALFKYLLTQIGITQICQQPYEADDLAGMLVHNLNKSTPITLVSSDKDWFQLLLRDSVTQVRGWKGKKRDDWNSNRVLEEFGVRAERWAEYLALVGDKTDNIKKALAGHQGPVVARKILNGTLPFPDEIKPQFDANLKVTTVSRDIKQSGLSSTDFVLPKRSDEGFEAFERMVLDHELNEVFADRKDIWAVGRWT